MKKFLQFFSRDISLVSRMLLIFALGAGLPMVISYILIMINTDNALREARLLQESGEVSVISEDIENHMLILENITHYMVTDLVLSGFGSEDFTDTSIVSRYHNIYNDYLERVVCYHYDSDLPETASFKYADAGVKNEQWYIQAVNRGGEVYWFYEFDDESLTSKLCVSRLITGVENSRLGVVYAVMEMKEIQQMIESRDKDTFLVYNNINVISNNTRQMEIDDILYALMDTGRDVVYRDEYSKTFRAKYMGFDAYMTYSGVGRGSEADLFAVVSVVRTEREAFPDAQTLWIFVPFIIGFILSAALIIVFSRSYSGRVAHFRRMLHDDAVGNISELPPEMAGSDEIGLMARDLHTIISEQQKLAQEVMEQRLGREMLNAKNREVEFRMLSSQINPHFLYNTLETMRMRALINGDKDVAELAKMLSKVMRHNLKVKGELMPVTDELTMVRYYMQIQDYRFGDRISYSINADDEVLKNYMMIPLTIQPFVENAYVHGLEGKESGGNISVTAEITDEGTGGILKITIADNGLGMDEKTIEQVKRSLNDMDSSIDHIGVRNVASRIRLLYGPPYGVDVESVKDEGTVVLLRMPVITL